MVRPRAASRPHTLPGFGLALGYTLFYLGVVVLIPLAGLVFKTFTIPWADFRAAVGAPRVMAALGLSFGAALVAAAIDVLLGLLIAWALVRYPFPGRRLADALVDLPFALPTAVAGISLTTLYSPNGWLGGFLNTLGVQIAFTRLGIVIALIFIGLSAPHPERVLAETPAELLLDSPPPSKEDPESERRTWVTGDSIRGRTTISPPDRPLPT
mgnify:CR=1 FL=1